MSPPAEGPSEPGLFDLSVESRKPPAKNRRPLAPSTTETSERERRPVDLPLFIEEPAEVGAVSGSEMRGTDSEDSLEPPPLEPTPAPFLRRVAAGIGDITVHAGVLAAAVAAMRLAEIPLQRSQWPALGLFLLVFSFVYHVVPLAFWGHTPGMVWAGLVARGAGGEPLTFGQTGLRWIGTVVTACTCGLLALPAIWGRSLTDWLSGSWVRESKAGS